MTYPIPAEALDDRLAWVGTSGSGKTYNAGTAIERVLQAKGRVVICDPLGVWHGLRVQPDGKTPAFPVVIFGGPHGDLPLTEHAGRLIGEAVAATTQSCIVDLSEIGTAAGERRFMLGFLRAIYAHATGEPLHLVLDEADMWAPQTIRDRDGDANKLFAITERIVRRGRIAGFIPWLITQRPAELSKSVLSQVDGLVAMNMTASQDRDALDAWIGGQADKAEAQRIKAAMPTLQRGQGVVWLPRRQILTTALFPEKATYDSSRTPKRGELRQTVTLKPLDLGLLKERLAAVEAEAKENDPATLKSEVARLKKQLDANYVSPAPAALEAEFLRGVVEGEHRGNIAGQALALTRVRSAIDALRVQETVAASPPPAPVAPKAAPVAREGRSVAPSDGVTGPEQKVLDALGWWSAFGITEPTHEQVAFVAGYMPTSGGFANLKGKLRSKGFIDYPAGGKVALTFEGATIAAPTGHDGGSAREVHQRVFDKLAEPQRRVLRPLLEAYPEPLTTEQLAAAAGYAPTSGGFANLRGSLRSLSLLDYPGPGQSRASDWLFP